MKKNMMKTMFIASVLILVLLGFSVFDNKSEEPAETKPVANETESEELENRLGTKAAEYQKNNTPFLVMEDARCKAGEKTTLDVSLVNNPGIIGMSTTLSYDDSKLELINVIEGQSFKNQLTMTHSKKLSSGCVFLWDGESLKEDEIKDCVLMQLVFSVKEDVESSTLPLVLTIDANGSYDNNLEEVTISVANGVLTIDNK